MTKQDWIRKLTSRKLWVAVALFVSGVITAAGNGAVAERVSGLIMQAAAVIGYILGEGLVDSKRAGKDAAEDAAEEEETHTNAIGFYTGGSYEEDDEDDPRS